MQPVDVDRTGRLVGGRHRRSELFEQQLVELGLDAVRDGQASAAPGLDRPSNEHGDTDVGGVVLIRRFLQAGNRYLIRVVDELVLDQDATDHVLHPLGKAQGHLLLVGQRLPVAIDGQAPAHSGPDENLSVQVSHVRTSSRKKLASASSYLTAK